MPLLLVGSPNHTSLSEGKISQLLPTIQNSEYYTRPDLRGLSNMLRGDQDALKAIHGLVVGRRGFGELKFLEPVNIEGLNICEVISITRGELLFIKG